VMCSTGAREASLGLAMVGVEASFL
jgi:hypothetical protein